MNSYVIRAYPQSRVVFIAGYFRANLQKIFEDNVKLTWLRKFSEEVPKRFPRKIILLCG
jgi:hypothetical protein